MIHQGQGIRGHDCRRVVGFVRGHGAAAGAAVVEAADLDAVVRFRRRGLRRADAGLLVRPQGLVVGGLQRPGQPLYLRAPRVVRPRQSFDYFRPKPNTKPFPVSAKRGNKRVIFYLLQHEKKEHDSSSSLSFRGRGQGEIGGVRTDDEEHLGGAAAVAAVEETDALPLVAVRVPAHLAVRHCCSPAALHSPPWALLLIQLARASRSRYRRRSRLIWL